MKYLKKFESNIESDNEFIVAKIVDNFPYDETKQRLQNDEDSDQDTILIDMINWFETEFDRQIEDEMLIMNMLRDEYDFLNNQ